MVESKVGFFLSEKPLLLKLHFLLRSITSCKALSECEHHCHRYPKIIVDCIEDQPQYVEGEEIPVDTSQPNPNGIEIDNLYLVLLTS